MTLTWDQMILEISRRLREPETGLGWPIPAQIDIPYYTRDDLEQALLEITQQKCREIPVGELDALGSTVISTVTTTSGDTMPTGAVRLLAVAIRQTAGLQYSAAIWRGPAQFRQVAGVSAGFIACYTVYDSKFFYIGNSARVTWLIEPTLADCRADTVIVPPVYDEERMDWVAKQMLLANYLPKERV